MTLSLYQMQKSKQNFTFEVFDKHNYLNEEKSVCLCTAADSVHKWNFTE